MTRERYLTLPYLEQLAWAPVLLRDLSLTAYWDPTKESADAYSRDRRDVLLHLLGGS